MNYYFDESGNTGDISLTKTTLDFGGQPVFALACIGLEDTSKLEVKITALRKQYNILSDELKTKTIYDKKPKFIKEVFQFIEDEKIPFFVEIVDKKYQLAINIVNHYVMPPYFSPPDNDDSILIRNIFSDFIHQSFPDELFVGFINTAQEPSNTKTVNYFNQLINYIKQNRCEISEALLMNVEESLDDYRILEKEEGHNTYKRFLPIPDLNKKNNLVWMLPHYSSFTNIYARINLCTKGNLSTINLIHDEQKHFDEIIKIAKESVEKLKGEITPSITPNSNYNFSESATLSFADSKQSIGIQVADLLSGFSMRFVSTFLSNKAISSEYQESFDILFNNGDPETSIGMNFVLSKVICKDLFNSVKIISPI